MVFKYGKCSDNIGVKLSQFWISCYPNVFFPKISHFDVTRSYFELPVSSFISSKETGLGKKTNDIVFHVTRFSSLAVQRLKHTHKFGSFRLKKYWCFVLSGSLTPTINCCVETFRYRIINNKIVISSVCTRPFVSQGLKL